MNIKSRARTPIFRVVLKPAPTPEINPLLSLTLTTFCLFLLIAAMSLLTLSRGLCQKWSRRDNGAYNIRQDNRHFLLGRFNPISTATIDVGVEPHAEEARRNKAHLVVMWKGGPLPCPLNNLCRP